MEQREGFFLLSQPAIDTWLPCQLNHPDQFSSVYPLYPKLKCLRPPTCPISIPLRHDPFCPSRGKGRFLSRLLYELLGLCYRLRDATVSLRRTSVYRNVAGSYRSLSETMPTIDVTGLGAVRIVHRIDAKGKTSIQRGINGVCHSLPILSVVAEKERYFYRFGYSRPVSISRYHPLVDIYVDDTQRRYLRRILYLSNLLNFFFSFLYQREFRKRSIKSICELRARKTLRSS